MRLIVIGIVFLLGLYFVSTVPPVYEGFGGQNCPDMLIQKEGHYYLYNKKHQEVPGVNPKIFKHLEDYSEFIDYQRSQGKRCPILYLQQGFDTQGNPNFQERPNFEQDELGKNDDSYMKLLDAARDDPPYNQNGYPGYDPDNQYIGEETPLDEMTKPPLIGAEPMRP